MWIPKDFNLDTCSCSLSLLHVRHWLIAANAHLYYDPSPKEWPSYSSGREANRAKCTIAPHKQPRRLLPVSHLSRSEFSWFSPNRCSTARLAACLFVYDERCLSCLPSVIHINGFTQTSPLPRTPVKCLLHLETKGESQLLFSCMSGHAFNFRLIQCVFYQSGTTSRTYSKRSLLYPARVF